MEKPHLYLRPATLADAPLLFKWRNDPITRAASHHQQVVEYESHLRWLENSLKAAQRQIYLAEINQVPIGTVRADYADGIYELSWTVAPEQRGKGLGTQMVLLLAEKVNGPIRAEVKVGNLASQRIAEACQMQLEAEKDGILYYSRKAHSPTHHEK